MAASSQGDEDDEERRALELELAAELAALSARDVGFDESWNSDDDQNDDFADCNGENEVDYVRLDLDNVLKQMTESEEQQIAPVSWKLLLQSVERSDREFFQPCREIIDEIRTSILDVSTPEQQQDQQPIIGIKNHTRLSDKEAGQPSLELAISQPEESTLPHSVDENEQHVSSVKKNDEVKRERTSTEKAKTITADFDNNKLNPELTESTLVEPNSLLIASDHPNQASPLPDVHPTVTPEENQFAQHEAKQKQLEAIAKQHEARELRRLKAQARHEKEQGEAAQLLARLHEEIETQERDAAISRQEAQERSYMAMEETFCRQFLAAEREAQETKLMANADENSHKVAAELTRTHKEIHQMEAEDQAERHRMKVKRQLYLQKQESTARCRFAVVLLDLAKYHENQRQIRDQQTKRERRECVQLRAEEAYTRRIIAENRALREQKEREMNRVLMIDEDKLAKAVEDQDRRRTLDIEERLRERRDREYMQQEEKHSRSAWAYSDHLMFIEMQNEENSRLAMEKEEERCRCGWSYLVELEEAQAKEREVHRLRILSNVSTGFQGLCRVLERHQLMEILTKWKNWYKQKTEEDRIRSETVENAAKRIQIWHRSCRQKLQHIIPEPPLVLEDFSDTEEPQIEEEDDDKELETEMFVTMETQEAARRLQSTFRGFHVRRKFANALALAQVVEKNDDGDSFDGVDLDDLIQLPPELVDGWEDPMLPPSSVLAQRESSSVLQRIELKEERFIHVDNHDVVDLENDKYLERAKPEIVSNPAKEQNLAATLWNKMKRVKQRQQNSRQERQRQQDPVYRVQKLLNRKTSNQNVSNQNGNSSNSQSRLQTSQGRQQATNMISWSSTTNTKKKPKVKLPSLVERLRKQTMAAR
ncbi:hypothetical protein F441_12339 [Phytophthora nicotianae CJ01A1]|uniref:Uncharacterized protein n=1 Tax=Phytophthora nicotianae CJ01A1 TaxID=1317063 RepID=W2WNY8_PHYNI|nr:hypothetical protein F441_12339 [Phytophthora nicotianae CJ01A1]